ncbi:MAG: hypothetical protein A2504_15660 [Bdellovibrionales bacterium RIFOXYD12_FULL_39_22]|nr:MAG: hypothetical protein A2385_03090 [Bdellovibrionales bacterium RIFOXYB1_FULL_39_21]OFZ43230.1 MAG: hypothetical protein A2485_12235 [Bdellovibrionales bacterium RIFOXYC12_FULL_39_17]OFZ47968.1 MAG: hypothetical protein A2404_16875 [Bdellovibrionales bacterium RIFOXYC1_FULL_39_130]OFZ75748.1 MAG: hypothetical protein A2560_13375 [Bdellovibrionales bacterium RIFOXYD1_FULL_39_84]OFZ75889.1 MAG: hypothetical protein A2451_03905 [Bdellovibrionales bacterium RIFOXYC2_FULL_39_8]OFZ94238.1 MAG:
MIQIGKINQLLVAHENKSGYYLQSEDKKDEVFMPGSIAPAGIKLGEMREVFVYTDIKGTPLATPEIPMVELGGFAYLKVIEVVEFGAFLDWGIDKDLLSPGNQQQQKMKLGESYLIRVCQEEGTRRLYATNNLSKFIERKNIELTINEKVIALPFEKTQLGYKALVNEKYQGLIYHSDIFSEIVLGERIEAMVKLVRPDGLIDLTLRPTGMKNLKDSGKLIMTELERAGGFLPLHDKSSPEEIKRILKISKQSFKRAIGILYKQRQIVIGSSGIELAGDNKRKGV